MAKAAVATVDDNKLSARLKSWPQRIKGFYNEVRNEMKKVTTPSLKDVQATTIVTIITVFIFGAFFWIVDGILGKVIDAAISYLTGR